MIKKNLAASFMLCIFCIGSFFQNVNALEEMSREARRAKEKLRELAEQNKVLENDLNNESLSNVAKQSIINEMQKNKGEIDGLGSSNPELEDSNIVGDIVEETKQVEEKVEEIQKDLNAKVEEETRIAEEAKAAVAGGADKDTRPWYRRWFSRGRERVGTAYKSARDFAGRHGKKIIIGGVVTAGGIYLLSKNKTVQSLFASAVSSGYMGTIKTFIQEGINHSGLTSKATMFAIIKALGSHLQRLLASGPSRNDIEALEQRRPAAPGEAYEVQTSKPTSSSTWSDYAEGASLF